MKEATAAKWFHQMAQTLAYLHTIGIAYRDIKPANILFEIGPNGGHRFVLTDFGLVNIFEHKDLTISSVPPKTKTYIGSENYMSPEIEGKSPDDEYEPFKADVFSVGVCLLQSLKTMFQSLVQKLRNNEL
jgi:serine/threonine protein kinase